MGRGEADLAEASDFGSLRTRSHSRGDPEWTVQDILILANEFAAVEQDCQNALSSHQKWGIIAENCSGLGVAKNLNQCRRKWESLLAEYKLINEWETNSRGVSYWSLRCKRRLEAGIPLDFDRDLYKVVNDFMKTQERSDTDPENDPEAAEIDVFDAVKPVPVPKQKRGRRRSIPRKGIIKVRKLPVSEEDYEKPWHVSEQMDQILAEQLKDSTKLISASNPKRVRHSSPQKGIIREKQQPMPVHGVEQMEQILAVKLKGNTELIYSSKHNRVKHWPIPQNGFTKEREQSVSDEEPEKPFPNEQMEQILAEKLKENTELIHAILAGNFSQNLETGFAEIKDEETLKTEMVRCKAEKLIACLGDLTKNLEQLCNVVEEG